MNTLPLASPPDNLCLLRLSAVGDVCHVVPVVRTLQKAWPQTRLTWIIGKLEHTLVGDIPGIEFIIFDKQAGLKGYRQLRQQMRGRHFDVLLHMQMSLRASLASLLIPADIRLGFDRQRAKDLQWLFTNHKIAHRERQHVMDSFFGFIETLGVTDRVIDWNIPVSDETHRMVSTWLPDRPYLVVSPCSSMSYRNWTSEGYAKIIDYAMERYHLATVLTGGPSSMEMQYGEQISALCRHKPGNLIGQTNLKQLLAIIQRAQLLIAPDSGPAHMASAVGTPVIGLYAGTNPDRARPYLSEEYVINRYPEAVQEKYGQAVTEIPWGSRVREANTMARITVREVKQVLDRLITSPVSGRLPDHHFD